MTPIVFGICLGFLIGTVTVIVTVMLLGVASRADIADARNLLILLGEILALPAFMVGGPWLAGELLAEIKGSEFALSYIVTLTAVYAGLFLPLLFEWIRRLRTQLAGN